MLKEGKVLIGIILFAYKGLPEVCIRVSGHLDFIETTNVSDHQIN